MSERKEEMRQRLAEKGYRLTKQRQVVLEVLQGTKSHPNANWIYQEVRKRIPNVSLGTIYRALSILKEAGLIQELNYGGSFRRYDDDVEEHYHITCTQCGRVVDVDLPLLSEVECQAAAATGFRVTDHHLEFYGICPDCSSSLRS